MEQWQLATAAKVPQPLASLWRGFGFALWYRLHDSGPHPTRRAVLLDSSKQLRPKMGEATRYAPRRKYSLYNLRCLARDRDVIHKFIKKHRITYICISYPLHIHLLVRQHASVEAPLLSWNMHCPRHLLDAWPAESVSCCGSTLTICDAISSLVLCSLANYIQEEVCWSRIAISPINTVRKVRSFLVWQLRLHGFNNETQLVSRLLIDEKIYTYKTASKDSCSLHLPTFFPSNHSGMESVTNLPLDGVVHLTLCIMRECIQIIPNG